MSTSESDASLKLVWLVLQVSSGQIGIPFLLVTLSLSRLRRLPTLYGLLATWCVSSIICSLLFYVDGDKNPEPSHYLCLTQASLFGAIPLMGAFSAFSLMYDGWITVEGKETLLSRRKFRTVLLLVLPWIAFLLAAIALFSFGYANPTSVRRKQLFYCSLKAPMITNTLGMLTIMVLAVTALYGGKISLLLRNRWSHFKARVSDSSAPERHMSSPYVAIRIALFAFCVVLSITLMLICVLGQRADLLDIFFACIPTIVLAIFGTQADVVRVWVDLLPKLLIPHRIRMWVRAKPIHYAPTLPTRNPSVTVNSFDVWKEKYLDHDVEKPLPVRVRQKRGSEYVMISTVSRSFSV